MLLSDLFQFQCSIFEKYICTSFPLIFSINSSSLISFYSIRYCVSLIAKCAYTAQIIIHQLNVKHAVINVITLLNKNYWNGLWFTLQGTWWMKIFTTLVTNDHVLLQNKYKITHSLTPFVLDWKKNESFFQFGVANITITVDFWS